MTAKEYQTAYVRARETWPNLTAQTMRAIRKVYSDSAKRLGEILTSGAMDGKSAITINASIQMQQEFELAAKAIQRVIVDEVPLLVSRGYDGYSKIEVNMLNDALEGIDRGAITKAGLQNIYVGVNQRLVETTLHRLGQDGYTLYKRAGRLGVQFQPVMSDVIAAGFAQGRDLAKIAEDLTKYVTDGKVKMVKRWGEELEPGSKAFLKRIPDRVDYRALRIARSELAMSLQEAARINGHINPGALDLFDWVRINSIDHSCACPALAANSPYKYADVPGYPHPNCHPAGTLVISQRGQVPIETLIPGDEVLSPDGSFNQVTHVWKNDHSGPMLTIKTEHGELLATPEHPLLTNSGWREAKTLKDGDNLRRESVEFETLAFVDGKALDAPAKGFKERSFTRILLLVSPGGMPAPAIDFNGELFLWKRKIDAPSANWKARLRFEAYRLHCIVERPLIGRPELAGKELNYLRSVFFRLGPTPDGIMSGSRVRLSTIGNGAQRPLADGRGLEAETKDILFHYLAADSEDLGYLVHREILVAEKLGQTGVIQDDFSTHNSAIVNVKSEEFKGTIYNLTVANTNAYFANGFASHNCECQIRPRLRDAREFRDELLRWANGEDVPHVNEWYTNVYRPAQAKSA